MLDLMPLLTKSAGTLLALYLVVVFAVWLGQRKLLYVPDPIRYAPGKHGLPEVDEWHIARPDGAVIVTWHAKPRAGQPTLLYFHGNAGGLLSRADRIQRYAERGIGVLMMSYRGYSGSTGSPSETANVSDAIAVYDSLVGSGVRPSDIVLYGESLGSGVALQVAAQRPVAGVILDAPYTSMVAMAQRTYPILPVRPLLADRYESDRHIARLKAPLLILHGAKDELIPVAMGRSLHAAATVPKELVVFPEGGHSDLDQHGAVAAVTRWLQKVRVADQIPEKQKPGQ
jgi:uncharacterized protein